MSRPLIADVESGDLPRENAAERVAMPLSGRRSPHAMSDEKVGGVLRGAATRY